MQQALFHLARLRFVQICLYCRGLYSLRGIRFLFIILFSYWCMHTCASLSTWLLAASAHTHNSHNSDRYGFTHMHTQRRRPNEYAIRFLNWQQLRKNCEMQCIFHTCRCSWMTLNWILITSSSVYFRFTVTTLRGLCDGSNDYRFDQFPYSFCTCLLYSVNGYQHFTIIIDSKINNSHWSKFTIHFREKMIIHSTHTHAKYHMYVYCRQHNKRSCINEAKLSATLSECISLEFRLAENQCLDARNTVWTQVMKNCFETK